jgi:hypothetical protein
LSSLGLVFKPNPFLRMCSDTLEASQVRLADTSAEIETLELNPLSSLSSESTLLSLPTNKIVCIGS